MKVFFQIIGIIIVAGIGLATYGTGLAIEAPPMKTLKIQKETINIAIDDINAISNNWDFKEFEKRAHPKLLAAKSHEEWDAYFKVYQALGKLKTPVSCNSFNYKYRTGAIINDGDAPVNLTEANYNCTAHYSNGDAKIDIQLIQTEPNGPWQIFRLMIGSSVFTKILRNT